MTVGEGSWGVMWLGPVVSSYEGSGTSSSVVVVVVVVHDGG